MDITMDDDDEGEEGDAEDDNNAIDASDDEGQGMFGDFDSLDDHDSPDW